MSRSGLPVSARSRTLSPSSVPIRAAPSVSPKARMAAAEAAGPLGIIAGSGDLPRFLIEACRGTGRAVYVVALQGETDPQVVTDVPHAWCRIGAGAALLDALHTNGVRDLVLAGGVKRPSLAALRPDWRAAKFIARVGY